MIGINFIERRKNMDIFDIGIISFDIGGFDGDISDLLAKKNDSCPNSACGGTVNSSCINNHNRCMGSSNGSCRGDNDTNACA